MLRIYRHRLISRGNVHESTRLLLVKGDNRGDNLDRKILDHLFFRTTELIIIKRERMENELCNFSFLFSKKCRKNNTKLLSENPM